MEVRLRKYGASNNSQSRYHICNWPGCQKEVPPSMWGCRAHLFLLPKDLRERLGETYPPGQDRTMSPSIEYLGTVKEVEIWIRDNK